MRENKNTHMLFYLWSHAIGSSKAQGSLNVSAVDVNYVVRVLFWCTMSRTKDIGGK